MSYNPNQPRDKEGQWSSGGGESGSAGRSHHDPIVTFKVSDAALGITGFDDPARLYELGLKLGANGQMSGPLSAMRSFLLDEFQTRADPEGGYEHTRQERKVMARNAKNLKAKLAQATPSPITAMPANTAGQTIRAPRASKRQDRRYF